MQLNIVTKEINSVPSNKLSEEILIQGILNNDSKVLNQIYLENFGKIKVMVLNFKNLRLDPQDVFQEGLTRAIINVRQNKFNKESSFSTYLYSICRNICLKEHQKIQKEKSINTDNLTFDETDHYFELLDLTLKIRDQLDEKCKAIIDLRFNLNRDQMTPRFENISENLGISAENARQRFKRCMSKLMNLVNANPEFKILFD